jgi:hypothetical protein
LDTAWDAFDWVGLQVRLEDVLGDAVAKAKDGLLKRQAESALAAKAAADAAKSSAKLCVYKLYAHCLRESNILCVWCRSERSEEEINKIADALGHGCVKYFDLKQARRSRLTFCSADYDYRRVQNRLGDYVFSYERMLRYAMYNHIMTHLNRRQ